MIDRSTPLPATDSSLSRTSLNRGTATICATSSTTVAVVAVPRWARVGEVTAGRDTAGHCPGRETDGGGDAGTRAEQRQADGGDRQPRVAGPLVPLGLAGCGRPARRATWQGVMHLALGVARHVLEERVHHRSGRRAVDGLLVRAAWRGQVVDVELAVSSVLPEVDVHRDGVGGGTARRFLLLDGLGIGVEQGGQPRRVLVGDLLETRS